MKDQVNTTEIPGELSRENMIYIYTLENNILSCFVYIINRTFWREMAWYFVRVCDNKCNITWPLLVLRNISLGRWDHSRNNFNT